MKQQRLPANLRWRGNVIWMRCQRGDNRFNESTHTSLVRDAQLIFAERLRRNPELRANKPVLSAKTMKKWDMERAMHEERADGTLQGIAYGWLHLERHVEDFQRLRYDDLHRYVMTRRAEGAGNNTISKELTLLKRGLARAADEGMEVKVPLRWPRLSVTQKKLTQAGREVTLLELHAFLRQLRPEAMTAALCALFTGARAEELTRLRPQMLRRVDHIAGLGGIVQLPAAMTKTKQTRRIGLTPLGVRIFEAAVPVEREYRNAFRRASARADVVPYIHYRTMRHTFATTAGQCGDPMGVQVVMGHSKTIALTYQHATDLRLAVVAQAVEAGLAIPEDILARVKP